MDIMMILGMLAGMGMFLYGMHIMSDSLQKVAGSKLETTLEKLTSNRFKGVGLGAAVTALIQSSAATTVMVVGFVNAGIMKLSQAVGVIMGANIGTTITAQILRLGDISGDASWIAMLKPATFAPVLIVIGAMLALFTKKKKPQNIGGLLMGLGLLFYGMSTMEKSMAPLADIPEFGELMVRFRNPIVGILVGAGVTALIQSSSASIGILQALSATGLVTFSTAVPIIFGQNIGTCITVLLSSIGANKNAKRAGLIHLYFNVIGSVVWLAVIYGVNMLWGIPFWDSVVNRGTIADFHTVFNIVNTVLMLPFTGLLIKLVNLSVRDKGDKQIEENLLDERFLATPAVAIEQCKKVIANMGHLAAENFVRACSLLRDYDAREMNTLSEVEDSIDRTESMLGNYLVRITSHSLDDETSKIASEIMHTISDFERIGDYSVNIAETAQSMQEEKVKFSKSAVRDIKHISDAVSEILGISIKAYIENDAVAASRVEPLEEVIDLVKESLKTKHIERLQDGKCAIKAGFSFLELLNNFERIADHCSNVAVYIIQLHDETAKFDPHEHLRAMHEGTTDEYKAFYSMYLTKYLTPVEQEKS